MLRPFLAKPALCLDLCIDQRLPVGRFCKARMLMVSQAATACCVPVLPWHGWSSAGLSSIPTHRTAIHPGGAPQLPATRLAAHAAGFSNLSPNRNSCLPGC